MLTVPAVKIQQFRQEFFPQSELTDLRAVAAA